jgi:ubiquinone/menaquinone biosynthesis C-methylase UbiE
MAGTYGVVNLVSSFGFAAFWRAKCVRQIKIEQGMNVVDLMTGMGELIPGIARRIGGMGHVRAIDLSPAMCQKARTLILKRKIQGQIIEDDALTHSVGNGNADIVVSSFGLKTFSVEQRKLLARQIQAMLKPGGRFSMVEISVPPSRLLQRPYMFYLKIVIPLIGSIFLGNPDNYRMLGVYTEAFENCEQFAEELNRVGLEARSTSYFFGCATGVTGHKPI